MKYLICISLLILLTGCGTVAKETIHDLNIKEISFAEARQELDTPEKISTYTSNNLPYTKDIDLNDEWKSPERTFIEGGDCEDFAGLFAYLLQGRVDDIKLVRYFNRTYGHAICVWRTEKGLSYSSNKLVYNTNQQDITSLINALEKNITFYDINTYEFYYGGK